MSQRIRYKQNNSILKSVQRFASDKGGLYEVELNLTDMTYKVRNVRQSIIVRSTEKDNKKAPTHLNTLKRQAKNALKSMGVKFNIELRDTDGHREDE